MQLNPEQNHEKCPHRELVLTVFWKAMPCQALREWGVQGCSVKPEGDFGAYHFLSVPLLDPAGWSDLLMSRLLSTVTLVLRDLKYKQHEFENEVLHSSVCPGLRSSCCSKLNEVVKGTEAWLCPVA